MFESKDKTDLNKSQQRLNKECLIISPVPIKKAATMRGDTSSSLNGSEVITLLSVG